MTRLRNLSIKGLLRNLGFSKSKSNVPEELQESSYEEVLGELQSELDNEQEKLDRLHIVEFKVLAGEMLSEEELNLLKSIDKSLLSF